jgi:hypothetical protein
MPETDTTLTPEQQAAAAALAQQAPAASSAAGENWKARFDGLVKKTEDLVLRIRQLETELATKTSENEQLGGQLSLKDVEKSAAVGERDKNIETLIQTNQATQTELARLKAMELKLKVATEMGKPELMTLAATIPDVTDPEALKVIMKNIDDYSRLQVKAREEQLLAGVTITAGGNGAPAGPGSDEEWRRKIEAAPLGTRERAKVTEDYGVWLTAQHTRR